MRSNLNGSMKHVLVVLFMVCVVPSIVVAENSYANRTLQEMAKQMPELPMNNALIAEVQIPKVNAKRNIIVERDADGVITHIGFKLFDRSIMEKHSTPLYYFLERYMLSLILLEDDKEVYTRLKMDHVKITSEIYPEAPLISGLQKIVSDDTSSSSIFITSNGKEYTVSCLNGEKLHIQITFPINYELVSGYTKLDAERTFYPQLLAFIASDTKDEYMELSEYDMESYKDGLFTAFQESYILGEMVATSFYKKNEDLYVPILDSRYTAESAFNLFNAAHKWKMTAEVTQSLYGQNNQLNYEVPVGELTRYLRSQGCRMYTGIKESDNNEIKLTVMAVQPELGYQHLLICSADKRILSNPEAYKMRIKMYCHIPTHNISSLLGENTK